MSVAVIQQEIGAGSNFNGVAPAGGLVRVIAHDASDAVVAGTKTWTFVNGAFTAADVGRQLLMAGTSGGTNDGVFTISAVNLATEIETLEAPGGDETAGATPWTQDIYEPTSEATTPNQDKDIKRYSAGTEGGLFDFGITGPHWISSIEIILGGQTTWSISKKDSDGDEVVLWAGETEADFVTLESDRILIFEEETLLVRTADASAAMKCKISLDRA